MSVEDELAEARALLAGLLAETDNGPDYGQSGPDTPAQAAARAYLARQAPESAPRLWTRCNVPGCACQGAAPEPEVCAHGNVLPWCATRSSVRPIPPEPPAPACDCLRWFSEHQPGCNGTPGLPAAGRGGSTP